MGLPPHSENTSRKLTLSRTASRRSRQILPSAPGRHLANKSFSCELRPVLSFRLEVYILCEGGDGSHGGSQDRPTKVRGLHVRYTHR